MENNLPFAVIKTANRTQNQCLVTLALDVTVTERCVKFSSRFICCSKDVYNMLLGNMGQFSYLYICSCWKTRILNINCQCSVIVKDQSWMCLVRLRHNILSLLTCSLVWQNIKGVLCSFIWVIFVSDFPGCFVKKMQLGVEASLPVNDLRTATCRFQKSLKYKCSNVSF